MNFVVQIQGQINNILLCFFQDKCQPMRRGKRIPEDEADFILRHAVVVEKKKATLTDVDLLTGRNTLLKDYVLKKYDGYCKKEAHKKF